VKSHMFDAYQSLADLRKFSLVQVNNIRWFLVIRGPTGFYLMNFGLGA